MGESGNNWETPERLVWGHHPTVTSVVKGGAWLLVGEIKGNHVSPFPQVLVGMQAVEKRDGVWPYGECFGTLDIRCI